MPQPGEIDLHYQIEDLDSLTSKLQRIPADISTQLLDLEDRVLKRLQKYPPELPGQTYERTGELGRAWAVSADSSGTITMTNDAFDMNGRHYAAWVQSPDHQAWMHVGRWTTTEEALDTEVPRFMTAMAKAVESGWASARSTASFAANAALDAQLASGTGENTDANPQP